MKRVIVGLDPCDYCGAMWVEEYDRTPVQTHKDSCWTATKKEDETEKKIPVAVWSGSFRIFGKDLKCHVLDNGQRVIDEDSLIELFGTDASEASLDEGELLDFLKWQRG